MNDSGILETCGLVGVGFLAVLQYLSTGVGWANSLIDDDFGELRNRNDLVWSPRDHEGALGSVGVGM